MIRIFSLILSLFILFSITGCSSKEQSSGSVVETKSAGAEDSSETTEAESNNTEDVQKEIPEKYRLKKNIPDDWYDPLPSSEYTADFPLLFGIESMVDGTREDINLPEVKDLFTIEELEAYFGMTVVVDEEANSAGSESFEHYYLCETGTSIPELWDGKVKIRLVDADNPAGVSYYIKSFYPDSHKIEGVGRRAVFDDGTVIVQVTDAAILSVFAEFKRPDDRVAEPADEKYMLDLAQFVCERFMAKLALPDRTVETDTETEPEQQKRKSFKALRAGEFEVYIDQYRMEVIEEYIDEINQECSRAIKLRPLRNPEFEKILTNLVQEDGPDVFITADRAFYEDALNQGLFGEGMAVAYEVPVIIVPAGNPKGITCLADLTNKDLRVGIADKETPEGQVILAMLEKAGFAKGDISIGNSSPSEGMIVYSVQALNTDVAIVHRNSVSTEYIEKLEFVDIEPDDLIETPILLFSAVSTEHPELVDQFSGFMLSERVQRSFEAFGYRPVK
jgi:molybdate transport system substrate-binding protein